MPSHECGFATIAGGVPGAALLVMQGPTLLVDIGFDPAYKPQIGIPVAGIKDVKALVDSGAGESCIDSLLAAQLGLPIVDKRPISGIGGAQEANIHLAQVYVRAFNHTIWGAFAGVHLAAGGQVHQALIGRTFLAAFKMVYDGPTGSVVLSR